MDNTPMTTQKALLVVGALVFLILLTLIVPARYVGMKSNKPQLILKNRDDFAALASDRNNNEVPDWRDLALASLSTTTRQEITKAKIDPAAKKRLADPNNLTSSFSKNVYVASVYADRSGGLSEQQKIDLVDSLLTAEGKKISVKTYTVTDLRAMKTETDTLRKAYGNELGLLLKKADKLKLTSNDIAIIEAFNVKQDESVLASLVIKKNNLTQIIDPLLAMSVPNSALSYHVLLINRLSNFRSVIENLAEAKNDPIRATIALKAYPESVKLLLDSMGSMTQYFVVKNVTFSKSDAGFILTSGYTKQ